MAAARVDGLERIFARRRLLVFEHDITALPPSSPAAGISIYVSGEADWPALAEITSRGKLRDFRRRSAAGRSCFTAWRGERPVGYGWVSDRIEPAIETLALPLPHDAVYCWDLYVLPAERNRGIGTALADARFEHARGLGFRRSWRLVSPGNAASLRVFEKVGREGRIVGELRAVTLPALGTRATFTARSVP